MDRESLGGAVRTIAKSPLVLWSWSICGPLIAFAVGLSNGLGDVAAIDKRLTATEKVANEAAAKAERLEAQTLVLQARITAIENEELWRDVDLWRGIVLSNATSKRADALQNEYDAYIGKWFPKTPEQIDERERRKKPSDAAHMTLDWGTVPRR